MAPIIRSLLRQAEFCLPSRQSRQCVSWTSCCFEVLPQETLSNSVSHWLESVAIQHILLLDCFSALGDGEDTTSKLLRWKLFPPHSPTAQAFRSSCGDMVIHYHYDEVVENGIIGEETGQRSHTVGQTTDINKKQARAHAQSLWYTWSYHDRLCVPLMTIIFSFMQEARDQQVFSPLSLIQYWVKFMAEMFMIYMVKGHVCFPLLKLDVNSSSSFSSYVLQEWRLKPC